MGQLECTAWVADGLTDGSTSRQHSSTACCSGGAICGIWTCTHCATLSIFYADFVVIMHFLTRRDNVSTKGGAEDNGCERVKSSADVTRTAMRHTGLLSRGAVIANKIHHFVSKAIVGLLACWLQSVVIKYCITSFSRSWSDVSVSHCFFTLACHFHTEPLNNAALSYSGKAGFRCSRVSLEWNKCALSL